MKEVFILMAILTILVFVACSMTMQKNAVRPFLFLGSIIIFIAGGTIPFITRNTIIEMILFFAALLLMLLGGFIGDLTNFFGTRKARKKGIKVQGVLKSVTPSGWFSPRDHCRELIFKLDYTKIDGTIAEGEVRESVYAPVETLLSPGMTLPVMYLDKMPGFLAFEKDIVSIINEKNQDILNNPEQYAKFLQSKL